MERTAKLLVTWHVGKRTQYDTIQFVQGIDQVVGGRFQISTDGFGAYGFAIPHFIGNRVDFGQVIKNYTAVGPINKNRYSPARISHCELREKSGSPDRNMICTSHIERHNLSIRMGYPQNDQTHERLFQEATEPPSVPGALVRVLQLQPRSHDLKDDSGSCCWAGGQAAVGLGIAGEGAGVLRQDNLSPARTRFWRGFLLRGRIVPMSDYDSLVAWLREYHASSPGGDDNNGGCAMYLVIIALSAILLLILRLL
jgi:hypothetical protein